MICSLFIKSKSNRLMLGIIRFLVRKICKLGIMLIKSGNAQNPGIHCSVCCLLCQRALRRLIYGYRILTVLIKLRFIYISDCRESTGNGKDCKDCKNNDKLSQSKAAELPAAAS